MKRKKTTLKSWQFKSKAVKITVFLLAVVMAFASVNAIIFDDMFAEAYTLQAQGLHNVVSKDTATITAEGAVDTAGKQHDVNRLIDGVTSYTSSTEEKSVAFTENGTPYFIVDLGDLYIDINEVRLYGLRKDNTSVTKYYPAKTEMSFATEKNEAGEYNWVTPSNSETGFFGWSVMNTTSYNAFDIRDEKFSYCGMSARYIKVVFTPNTSGNKLCQIELAEIEVWSYGKAKAEAPAFSEALMDKSSGNDINEAFMYYDEETGKYKNMTSLHQMEPGTKMYVAVVHKDTNMFLRQTLTGGGYYYTATPKASYMKWDRLTNNYGTYTSGTMKYHIWVLYKDAGGAFEFRAPYEQYEPTIGTRKIALNLSAAPEIKQWYSTRSEEQRFELIESETDNGEGVTYKIFGRYSKYYINIDGGDSTAVKKAGETSLSLTKNDNEADEWYILPILQNNNKDTHYGYSGSSSDIDPEDRAAIDDEDIYASIKNMETGMLLTQDQSLIKKYSSFAAWDGGDANAKYYYSVFRNLEINKLGTRPSTEAEGMAGAPQQLFRLNCDGKGISPAGDATDQFMLWKVTHAGSALNRPWGLDVDYWYQGQGNTVGIYQTYADGSNGDSTSRFFFFYSLNEDGGYYISTPSNWDSAGNGEADVYHLAALYVEENATEKLVSGAMHTDNYLKAGKFEPSSNFRFFINTSKETETINSKVQDVVVEQDENGNWQIIEGHEPLGEYDTVEVCYNSAFEMPSTVASYDGYTYLFDNAVMANRVTPIGYRYYRKNTYNITFNAGTLAQNPANVPYTVVIDSEEPLGDSRFINRFNVDLQYNDGSAPITGGYVEHTLNYWVDDIHGVKFSSLTQLKNHVKDLNLGDGGNYSFTAVWNESIGYSLPVDITRDGYALYGWSFNESIKSENDLTEGVIGVTEDRTVYAYWLGTDVDSFTEKRDNLEVGIAVYGYTQKQFVTEYDGKYTYEWFRVGADGVKHKVFANTTKAYDVTDADRGYILKAETTINGTKLKDTYSALIPTAVKVDAEPAEGYVTESSVPTEVNVNILSLVTYFIDAPKDKNGNILPVSGIYSSTGVVYKLYGVLPDETKVLVLNSNEVTLEELNGISKEGICFEKYEVVFSNPSEDTPLKITEDNFALLALPRLYKIEVSGGTCNVHYLVSDYVKGDRANDGVYSYYYDNDVIRIEVPVTNGSKLSAGSYIVVDGVKIYPVYSNSTGGNVVFEYINELDVLVNKNAGETKQAIVFAKADKKVEINIKTESNADANEENVNIGPLGAKVWDVDDVKKIRFGSVWYLDDLVSSNRWYRDEGFGTYLVLLNNLFKYKDSTNDFYVYLTGKNDASINALITKWSDKKTYPTVTDEEKKLMLGYLADFVKDWNAQKDVSKMSFGSGVANDVKAGYYYYHKGNLVDGVRKAYVEYSAVLKIPNEMTGREIIYLPYASFVKDWYYGTYNPSESTHPDSIYVFKAPEKIYTYGNVSGSIAIEDMDILVGDTAEIIPEFENVKYNNIVYSCDENDYIEINGNVITAKKAGGTVTVTATTPYHIITFEVSTKSKLTVENVTVNNGTSVKVPFDFGGTEEYTVEYIFTSDAISIDKDGNITVNNNRVDETVEVIAKTPYEEVQFYVYTAMGSMSIDKDLFEVVVVGNAANVTETEVKTGIDFTDGVKYPVTYTFEGNDISIDESGVITAINPDKTISVTASTEYGHSKTFTVKTYELPTIKDVTVFVDNVIDVVNVNHIDQGYNYPATDYYPQKVDGDISFNALVKGTADKANVKFYQENGVWFVDNDGELLAGNYDGKATYKNVVINFNVKAVETNKAQAGGGDKGYAWVKDEFLGSVLARNEQYKHWLDSTYINGQNVRNETTLFIGDSFFDVSENYQLSSDDWFWFPFYTDANFYKDKNAFSINIGSTTTYDWEQWLTDEEGWLKMMTDTPKNLVVNLGTNNIGDDFKNSTLPNDDVGIIVAEDLQRFLLALHEKFPETPIYWYDIAHRYGWAESEEQLEAMNARAVKVNNIMSSWCAERGWVTYVSNGLTTRDEYVFDGLHPSYQGHQTMKASLLEAMPEGAITERKPENIKIELNSVGTNTSSMQYITTLFDSTYSYDYYIKGNITINNVEDRDSFVSLEFWSGTSYSSVSNNTNQFLEKFSFDRFAGDNAFTLRYNTATNRPATHRYGDGSTLSIDYLLIVVGQDVYFLTMNETTNDWELKIVFDEFLDRSVNRIDLIAVTNGAEATYTFSEIGRAGEYSYNMNWRDLYNEYGCGVYQTSIPKGKYMPQQKSFTTNDSDASYDFNDFGLNFFGAYLVRGSIDVDNILADGKEIHIELRKKETNELRGRITFQARGWAYLDEKPYAPRFWSYYKSFDDQQHSGNGWPVDFPLDQLPFIINYNYGEVGFYIDSDRDGNWEFMQSFGNMGYEEFYISVKSDCADSTIAIHEVLYASDISKDDWDLNQFALSVTTESLADAMNQMNQKFN